MSQEETATSIQQEDEITFLEDFIAGGLAGSASVIVGHPFDTVKVLLQTSSEGSKGILQSIGGVGGVSSLFRGMVAPLSMATVINAIIFSSYASSARVYDELFLPSCTSNVDADAISMNEKEEYIQNTPPAPSSYYQMNKNFVCGCFAGAIQTLVICPTEHVKCRLQTQSSSTVTQYKGPLDAVKKITSQHGIRGLYRGFGCTSLREIPAFGVYFAAYDYIKDYINDFNKDEDDTQHAWMASAIAGGISGSITWGMIYPVDMIKSRIQTDPLTGKQYSMMEVGMYLQNKYGWRYLYRGLGVTLVRAFPVNGIIFPVYEFALLQLRSY
uniref:Mitochondrial carrier protein n=1 Tax=Ditylum brightwellii TaxID=49249 RepID=A0A7S4VZ96_9STRA